MEIGHTCGGESQTSRDSEKPHPIAGGDAEVSEKVLR